MSTSAAVGLCVSARRWRATSRQPPTRYLNVLIGLCIRFKNTENNKICSPHKMVAGKGAGTHQGGVFFTDVVDEGVFLV